MEHHILKIPLCSKNIKEATLTIAIETCTFLRHKYLERFRNKNKNIITKVMEDHMVTSMTWGIKTNHTMYMHFYLK